MKLILTLDFLIEFMIIIGEDDLNLIACHQLGQCWNVIIFFICNPQDFLFVAAVVLICCCRMENYDEEEVQEVEVDDVKKRKIL